MTEGSESEKGDNIVHPRNEIGLCDCSLWSRRRLAGKEPWLDLVCLQLEQEEGKMTGNAGERLRISLETWLIEVPSADKDGK